MRSIINHSGCINLQNCTQGHNDKDSLHSTSEGVLLNHLYVGNTTLIKLNQGTLTISSNTNDALECSGESLILIEKNQTLSVNCNDIDNHLDFKLIDISPELIRKIFSLLSVGNELAIMQKKVGSHILCSLLRPGMNEAFDNVYNCLKKMHHRECGDCTSCQTGAEGSPLDFTLIFLLSAFTAQEDGINILTRAVQSNMREKTFNIIKNDPSRIWNLDNVAAKLYMSRSTLKRKLAIEETSFSEIYLDVRMNMAARFLRTGDYNITQVALMCGYNSPSYFITTFKKFFQMTPYTFMKMANH